MWWREDGGGGYEGMFPWKKELQILVHCMLVKNFKSKTRLRILNVLAFPWLNGIGQTLKS